MPSSFFDYNLPIQVQQRENGETIVLLYLPRKECINGWAPLSEVLDKGMTRERFFNRTADIYERLAKQMRAAATEPAAFVYYPDEDPKTMND